MNWLQQSALAFVAYHVSSVVTIVQMNVASVVAPEKYNWIMDSLASVTVPAWEITSQALEVCWEFLTTSY